MFPFLKANPTHQTIPHSSLHVVTTHTVPDFGCASSSGHLREHKDLPRDAIPSTPDPEREHDAHPSRCRLCFLLMVVYQNAAKSDTTRAMWQEHDGSTVRMRWMVRIRHNQLHFWCQLSLFFWTSL